MVRKQVLEEGDFVINWLFSRASLVLARSGKPRKGSTDKMDCVFTSEVLAL